MPKRIASSGIVDDLLDAMRARLPALSALRDARNHEDGVKAILMDVVALTEDILDQ